MSGMCEDKSIHSGLFHVFIFMNIHGMSTTRGAPDCMLNIAHRYFSIQARMNIIENIWGPFYLKPTLQYAVNVGAGEHPSQLLSLVTLYLFAPSNRNSVHATPSQ